MLKTTAVMGFVFLALFQANVLAGSYSKEKLEKSGVSMRDGMHYCAALGSYVRPYVSEKDVEECAYATEAQKICVSNENTRWISGRCFCPETNRYFEPPPPVENKRRSLSDPKASTWLQDLSIAVLGCPAFVEREHPFARTVVLVPHETGYLVQKESDGVQWFNYDDYPGEQGNPQAPMRIATALRLPLGFGISGSDVPIFPTFQTLMQRLKSIKSDVSFFEVNGELSGREYLEAFVNNQLPIARIETHGDATYFVHDLTYHVLSFVLLPREIRELAQKQTRAILDFIDYFQQNYPKEWNRPHFKFMAEYLIRKQVEVIDQGIGQLTVSLTRVLKEQDSLEAVLESLAQLDPEKKRLLGWGLTRIIEPRNRKPCFSIYDFFHIIHSYEIFDQDDDFSRSTFVAAKLSYVNSLGEDAFKELKLKALNSPKELPTDKTSIDLLLERVSEVHDKIKRSEARFSCNLL